MAELSDMSPSADSELNGIGAGPRATPPRPPPLPNGLPEGGAPAAPANAAAAAARTQINGRARWVRWVMSVKESDLLVCEISSWERRR